MKLLIGRYILRDTLYLLTQAQVSGVHELSVLLHLISPIFVVLRFELVFLLGLFGELIREWV